MIRLYLGIGLMVLAGLAWWHYDRVVTELATKTNELAIKDQALKDEKAITKKQNQALVDANVRASNYEEQTRTITDEKAKLDKCITDKSCGFSVRYKPLKVPTPTSVQADAGKPPSDGEACEFGEDFQRGVSALWESIQRDAKQIEALQAELVARSDENYCRVVQ